MPRSREAGRLQMDNHPSPDCVKTIEESDYSKKDRRVFPHNLNKPQMQIIQFLCKPLQSGIRV